MILGPLLAQEFEAAFAPWNGVELQPFCLGLGTGIALSLSGQLQFATADIGAVAGAGSGTCSGISGLVAANISQVCYAKGQSFWASSQRDGPGVEWQGFCDKMAAAFCAHVKKNAELNSIHTPVFAGNGKVQKYYGVTADQMAGLIVLNGPPTWAKERYLELAMAVSTGIITEITGHSPKDAVSIIGAPAGVPAPGGGVGSGTVL